MLALVVFYIYLPMQKINEFIFPVPEVNEEETYLSASLTFNTVRKI